MIVSNHNVAIGRNIEATILSSWDNGFRCRDRQGQAILDDWLEQLTTQAPDGLDFNVTVLSGPTVNAYALPGGRIIISRGLLRAARYEEEVIGVLAHEVAHVLHRHGMEAMAQNAGLSILTSLFGASWFGTGDGLVALGELSYSRAAEEEANRTAVELLRAAGLPDTGLASFLTRPMVHQTSGGAWAILSIHPNPADRIGLLPRRTAPVPFVAPVPDELKRMR